MVLKWFGNDRSLSWEQRSDHLPWEAVVEAVAVLAPWNDETCPLGDGRCGAWLSAGRPSRQPGCAVQNVDNLRTSSVSLKLFRYYISPSHTSHTSHTSHWLSVHQRFDPVAPFQASGCVGTGACANPSRPSRPCRARDNGGIPPEGPLGGGLKVAAVNL